jgi:hypothetical protein
MAAKRKTAKSRTRAHGLSGSVTDHAERMRAEIASAKAHLKSFHAALDKAGACRSIGRDAGADEKLFNAISASARAYREAKDAGLMRDSSLIKLDGDVDSAAIEFSRRCVRVSPDID